MLKSTKQIIAGAMVYFTVIGQVFGQAALLPNAEQQYLDNNGKPLASGTVTYYVPGTTTKKTTWQNSAQTINNTNPVNLDIGGKGIMYGQGVYRQVLQDNLGNIIWDQPTTAYGASQPSGATGTDTAPVGSVIAYSGFVVPTNWALAYGQALSRTTFAQLMTAITISAPSVSCVSMSTTLTGFVDTSIIRIGAPIEATCLPTSTTVASITNATTIVVSQAAAATSTVTATIFPWGSGDQVTTFNVPDYRGRAPVGADCMGYMASGSACAGNLTATYYGSNPGAPGQTGGSQSKNIGIANINAFTPTGTISSFTPSGSIANGAITISPALVVTDTPGNLIPGGSVLGAQTATSASQATSTFSGNSVTPTFTGASLGSGTAFSVVNPDATTNYIIKVTPNSTGAGGVVSFGGMFGDIICNSTLTCAPVGSVNTVGCTPASNTQLGCVEPDGVSVIIAAGKLSAIAGIASSIGIGSTTVTGGTNTNILSVGSGTNLAQIAPSGTGSVCMTVSCIMTTPTLGAATATSLNTNFFAPGGYTLAGAAGKTLTFNNTLTLAGVDSTTLTFQGTDTYVGRTTTDTLTNKTINGASNSLTVRLGSDVTGNLPLANLATGTQDTALGYWTGTGVSALAIGNCSNALTYSTSTHAFGCNTTAGTGTLTEQKNTASVGIAQTGNCDNTSTNASSPCDTHLALTNTSFSGAAISGASVSVNTAQMNGLGSVCKLTPTYSGRISIQFNWDGQYTTGSGSFGVVYSLRFADNAGTATPAANSSIVGSAIAGPITYTATVGSNISYSLGGIVTGLTPGHLYWFDIATTSNGTTASQIPAANCYGHEF